MPLSAGNEQMKKIEHRLFAFISHEVIVKLIAATTNRGRLKVACQLDTNAYPKAIKASDELAAVNIQRDSFHGEWNYTISPKVSLQ